MDRYSCAQAVGRIDVVATYCDETEPDYSALRLAMVRKQLESRGIRDRRVLEAMRVVPRHRFIPEARRYAAYDDMPLEIGYGQTISQPYMVGLMTQMLEVQPSDRILEIGTGSGYQAAVLALLAHEVFTVERVPELARRAQQTLYELGYDNVRVYEGDGTHGLPECAPYDGIIVTAGAPHVPQALKEQLADGGRLVCPVGPRGMQHLVRIVRRADRFCEEEGIGCIFVPLIGADGWKEP